MMNLLIKKIKEKNSLNNLDDSIIEEELKKHLPKNTIQEELKNPKSANFKRIVKNTRNELNRIYGCFILNKKFNLESHSSTKERLFIYPRLYKDIFAITGKPKLVLDISAGYNPLSYKHLNCKPQYTATELSSKDVKQLNTWFKENNLNGKAIQLDLKKTQRFPKADITFLFKVLDLLNDFKLAEEIIKNIKSKYIIISFSTKTLKNKNMNYPRRGWLERMLKRLNKEYKILNYSNEIFYVIKN